MIIPSLALELQEEEVVRSEIPGYYKYFQSEKLKEIFLFGHEGNAASGNYQCKVYMTVSLKLIHPDDLPKEQSVWEILARPKEKRKR